MFGVTRGEYTRFLPKGPPPHCSALRGLPLQQSNAPPPASGLHRHPRAGWWGLLLTDSPPCLPPEEDGYTGRQSRRPNRTLEDPQPSFR